MVMNSWEPTVATNRRKPDCKSRLRIRTSVLSVITFLIVFGSTMFASSANAKAGLHILSPDTSACDTPASTPACASKTWVDCLAYQNTAFCAEIGRPDIVFWSATVSDDRQQVVYTKLPPRTDPLDLDPAPILGVREVPRSRFIVSSDILPGINDTYEINPDRHGTHEVMRGWPGSGFIDAYSHFFRKHGDRWVLTAWSWHFNEACDGVCTDFDRHCRYFIHIVPWDKWSEEM